MIAAIDPGVSGAIALFGDDGMLSFVADMPLIRTSDGSIRSPTPVTSGHDVGLQHRRGRDDHAARRRRNRHRGSLGVVGRRPRLRTGRHRPSRSPVRVDEGARRRSDKNVHRQAAKGCSGATGSTASDDGRADAALIGWWWLTKGRPGHDGHLPPGRHPRRGGHHPDGSVSLSPPAITIPGVAVVPAGRPSAQETPRSGPSRTRRRSWTRCSG